MRGGTATETRIKEAALRLFVERGVDAVSVRDITTAAEIRPSTLYVHWPSRDALVAELFTSGFAAYAASLAAVAAEPGSFRDRLAALVRRVCALYGEDPLLFQFLLLSQHQNLRGIPADDSNPIEILQRVVAAAMAEGEIGQGDPALLTAAIVGIVVQIATFRHYGRIAPDLAQLSDQVVALCLKLVAVA